MTIQDWGAIGELVGGAAVVVTLAYLALQVRQNSQLLRISIAQAEREGNVEIQRIIAGNSEAARIHRLGLSSRSSLSEDERFQFDGQLSLIFSHWEQAQEHGYLRESHLRWILHQPGGRSYWKEYRDVFSDSLRRRVEVIVSESPAS